VRAVADDLALARGVNVCRGSLTCEMVAESLNRTYTPLADVL
jgi:alanine dehydrogenase